MPPGALGSGAAARLIATTPGADLVAGHALQVGLGAMALAGLVFLLTGRGRRREEVGPAPAPPRKRARRPTKAVLELQARLDDALEQLESQQQALADLQAVVERRLETAEASGVEREQLLRARSARQEDLERLESALDAHRRELTALERAVDVAPLQLAGPG